LVAGSERTVRRLVKLLDELEMKSIGVLHFDPEVTRFDLIRRAVPPPTPDRRHFLLRER
jgi:hypothetical protein